MTLQQKLQKLNTQTTPSWKQQKYETQLNFLLLCTLKSKGNDDRILNVKIYFTYYANITIRTMKNIFVRFQKDVTILTEFKAIFQLRVFRIGIVIRQSRVFQKCINIRNYLYCNNDKTECNINRVQIIPKTNKINIAQE